MGYKGKSKKGKEVVESVGKEVMESGGKTEKGKEAVRGGKGNKGKEVVEPNPPKMGFTGLNNLDETMKNLSISEHFITVDEELDEEAAEMLEKYMVDQGYLKLTEREVEIERLLRLREAQAMELNKSVNELRKTIDAIEKRLRESKKKKDEAQGSMSFLISDNLASVLDQ